MEMGFPTGMGFSMGMGIRLQLGNENRSGRWEREWPLFQWEKNPANISPDATNSLLFLHSDITEITRRLPRAEICALLCYSTIEIFLADFQSTVNGALEIFLYDWCPVFCETVFLLLVCRLFAFTLYCFAAGVWESGGNGNNPMRIPRKWEYN